MDSINLMTAFFAIADNPSHVVNLDFAKVEELLNNEDTIPNTTVTANKVVSEAAATSDVGDK